LKNADRGQNVLLTVPGELPALFVPDVG